MHCEATNLHFHGFIFPALPKDIGNEHVRIKDILYLKFMFYHIAIPSLHCLHYIFWNAYEGYKTPRSKKLQRRHIYFKIKDGNRFSGKFMKN